MALPAALAVLVLLLVAGCGEDEGTAAAPEAPVTTPADNRVSAAIDDLASQQSVDASDVTVAQWGAVTWSDSSLGCPEPGMSYLQALTDGYLLVLEADGKRYEYHGGAQGALRYCENPKPPAETAE